MCLCCLRCLAYHPFHHPCLQHGMAGRQDARQAAARWHACLTAPAAQRTARHAPAALHAHTHARHAARAHCTRHARQHTLRALAPTRTRLYRAAAHKRVRAFTWHRPHTTPRLRLRAPPRTYRLYTQLLPAPHSTACHIAPPTQRCPDRRTPGGVKRITAGAGSRSGHHLSHLYCWLISPASCA